MGERGDVKSDSDIVPDQVGRFGEKFQSGKFEEDGWIWRGKEKENRFFVICMVLHGFWAVYVDLGMVESLKVQLRNTL